MLLLSGLTMPNIVVYYHPIWNGFQRRVHDISSFPSRSITVENGRNFASILYS